MDSLHTLTQKLLALLTLSLALSDFLPNEEVMQEQAFEQAHERAKK